MRQHTREGGTGDTYRSIASAARAEIKVKGSRFLAVATCVRSEGDITDTLATIRKEHYTARHHCFAYRLGAAGDQFRYSDDGEPNGTAGPPILRQIDGRSLTNTLIVVTRYFGGTKLGTGGLIRAYSDAASEVLENASVEEHILRETLDVRFAYPDTSPAMHTIEQFDISVVATAYSEDTCLSLAIRRSQVDAFVATFTERLHGRGTIVRRASD